MPRLQQIKRPVRFTVYYGRRAYPTYRLLWQAGSGRQVMLKHYRIIARKFAASFAG
jgi:hypothetical protein